MTVEKTLYYGAKVFLDGSFQPLDVVVDESSLLFFEKVKPSLYSTYKKAVDCSNYIIVPGFADVHVHLRQPGFSYKETVKTGTAAAARGGYTIVCPMPNVTPPPDSLKNLNEMLKIIADDALIQVLPYGTITKGQIGQGELSSMSEMAAFVLGFSDDGKGVQDSNLMQKAMLKAKSLSLPIVAHCEDESFLEKGGVIHKGEYAKKHGYIGISSESEWKQVERDIELVRKTGCSYHICHISTKETVEFVRQAKKDGLKISCETAPHYLVFCEDDLEDSGDFKMNPPLRSLEDKNALIEGLKDGTIDMIATDHAPHSHDEKSKGLKGSMFGIVGLETAFSVLYTKLVKTNVISLEKLIELMAIAPRDVFKLNNPYEAAKPANFTVIDLNKNFKINPDTFLSMGKANPFTGMNVSGEVIMTICNGKLVYES